MKMSEEDAVANAHHYNCVMRLVHAYKERARVEQERSQVDELVRVAECDAIDFDRNVAKLILKGTIVVEGEGAEAIYSLGQEARDRNEREKKEAKRRIKNDHNPEHWTSINPEIRSSVRAGVFPPDADRETRLMLAVMAMVEEGGSIHDDDLYAVCNEIFIKHGGDFDAATAAVLSGKYVLALDEQA